MGPGFTFSCLPLFTRTVSPSGAVFSYIRAASETKHPLNPVIPTGSIGVADAYSSREAEHIEIGGVWYCWYDAWPDADSCQVALVASEVNPWAVGFDLGDTVNYGIVIPKTAGVGTWGYGATAAIKAIVDPDTGDLLLFVSATKETGDLYTGPLAITLYKVAAPLTLARLTTAANYVLQNSGDAVLDPDDHPTLAGSQGFYAPEVKILEGVKTMIVSTSNSGSAYEAHCFTSTDWLTWTPIAENPVFTDAEEPCIVQLPGGALLNISDLYPLDTTFDLIGGNVLTTNDPTGQSGWERRPIILEGSSGWDALTLGPFSAYRDGNNIRLAYSGGVDENRAIGLATLTVIESEAPNWSWPLSEAAKFSETGDVLTITVPDDGLIPVAYRAPNQGFADVSASAQITFSGVATGLVGQCIFGIRDNNQYDGWAASNGYVVAFGWKTNDEGSQLYRQDAGASTALGSRVDPGDIATGVPYILKVVGNGTSINVYLQRTTDDLWLDSAGDWQAGEVAAITATGQSAHASNTEVFIAAFNDGDTQTITVENVVIESA